MRRFGRSLLINLILIIFITYFVNCVKHNCSINVFEITNKGDTVIIQDTLQYHSKNNIELTFFYKLDSLIKNNLNYLENQALLFDKYKLTKGKYENDTIREYFIESTSYNISGILFFHTNYGLIYYKSLEGNQSYKLISSYYLKSENLNNINLTKSILFIDSILYSKKGTPPLLYELPIYEEFILIRDSF